MAIPIGSGPLGEMIFGGVILERIALSESTAWFGVPGVDDVNPDALQHLAEIRHLLFTGQYHHAYKKLHRIGSQGVAL